MPNGKNQKTQCEMKTDLNLLLECLKYQMNNPASQKEALITIYSVCQENSDACDYFREIGGLMFVHNLAKSSTQSAVREASLFTLGGLAENNIFCQQILCTSEFFEDLRMFLINEDSSVNLKRVSVYVLLMLTSNNKSGQTCVRESGCLDVLLQLFRTTLSVSEVSMLYQNINQYHLWSSVCSTLCACVNNPHNEVNQNACSLVFPHAKYWLHSCIKPEIVRPICSFIGLTVANNSRIQHFFASIGGLAILDELLVKLIQNSAGNCSNAKLAVVVIKTLDACIADNSAIGVSLSRFNIVANLLMLLSYNILDSDEKFSVILTLGHCTDGCEKNQYAFVKNNGLPLIIQALTESQDEELNKAATFVLQNCKAITEKLSLKPAEHSLNMDTVGEMEVNLQNRERIFEDYQDKAKQILCRIEQLEKEYQEEICSSVQTLKSKGSHQKSYPVNKGLCCLQHEEQKEKRSTPEVHHNRFCERSINEEHKLHEHKQFCSVAPEQSHNNPMHLNEKVRRQILIDAHIPQEELMQMTSKHFQINSGDQHSNEVVTHTKINQPLLNSAYEEEIPAKCTHGLSKNELLKTAIGNAMDASVSQSEHSKRPHSADKMKMVAINKVHTANKSIGCESNKSDVQAREVLFKQPDFVVGSMTPQVQNTGIKNLNTALIQEPIELYTSTSSRRTSCMFTPSVNPKVSGLRCSGCGTVGLSLNSRNFSKILQSCKYLCEQHKVILETETKYKRKLKRSVVVSKTPSTDYKDMILMPLKEMKNSSSDTMVNMNKNSKLAETNRLNLIGTTDLQTVQDICLKEHPIKHKTCFKDQHLNENQASLLDQDKDAEIHLSNIPATVFKKQQRRTRKDFTSEEISYLLEGVKKMGHHWNLILWSYPFQKGRTNVDLAKKYFKLQRNEKNKNI